MPSLSDQFGAIDIHLFDQLLREQIVPGHSSAPTVVRLGPGEYEVDFGASLNDYVCLASVGSRAYLITLGQTRVYPFGHSAFRLRSRVARSRCLLRNARIGPILP